jgi:hypothetical protein
MGSVSSLKTSGVKKPWFSSGILSAASASGDAPRPKGVGRGLARGCPEAPCGLCKNGGSQQADGVKLHGGLGPKKVQGRKVLLGDQGVAVAEVVAEAVAVGVGEDWGGDCRGDCRGASGGDSRGASRGALSIEVVVVKRVFSAVGVGRVFSAGLEGLVRSV